MVETQWDIQEVKYLKKKQLVQGNLAMLLLFVPFGYLAENGKPSLLFGAFVCTFLDNSSYHVAQHPNDRKTYRYKDE